MEQQDWIAGYSWYSFQIHQPQGYTSTLFFEDGSLTALGRYYASITNENPQGDQSIEPDDTEAFLARALTARAARSAPPPDAAAPEGEGLSKRAYVRTRMEWSRNNPQWNPTREELEARFDALDIDGDGFLSEAEQKAGR